MVERKLCIHVGVLVLDERNGRLTAHSVVLLLLFPAVWVCVGAAVVPGGFQSLLTSVFFDLKCFTKEHQKVNVSSSFFYFFFFYFFHPLPPFFSAGRWRMLIPQSGGVE